MKKNKIFLILLSLLITACTNLTPDPQTASPAPEFGSALDLEVKKELLEIPLINDKNEKLNLNSFNQNLRGKFVLFGYYKIDFLSLVQNIKNGNMNLPIIFDQFLFTYLHAFPPCA